MADGASVGRSASSYDVSSMGSREQSEMAESTFSNLDGMGASSGKSWVADKAVLYLSATGRWAFESSWKLQGIFFLYHHVFLALYALHPLWGHAFSYDNSVARMALRLLGHGWATVAEDQSLLVGLLITAVVLTTVHVLLAFHLAWTLRRKKSPFLGETVVVRVLEVFYIKLLGLPALGVMLSPLTCQWGSTSPAGIENESIILPGTACSGSLATMGAIGLVVALLLHIPLYLGVATKECELNPLTKIPLQAGSAPANFRVEVLKISSLCVVHLAAGLSPVGAGFLTVCLWAWILYISVARVPYLGHTHSVVRAAVAGSVTWMFAAATAQSDGNDARVALAAGGVAFGALFGAMTAVRIRRATRAVAKYYAVRSDIGPTSRRYKRFQDEEEPELLMRMLRASIGQTTLPEESKAGLVAAVNQASYIFPESGDVTLVLAAVNAFLLNDVHTATSCLQKAKSVKTSLPTRMAILLLERLVRKRQNIEKGDSMDWATYVELQDNMRLLLNTHKKAIKSANEVWRVLLKHDIGVDDIATAVKRMNRFEVIADEAYRSMLERHPNQPRLMTLYGKFLEEVQGNTHAAARYFQEAEKLEDANEVRGQAEEQEVLTSQANIDDTRDGVCVITAEGIITFANSNLARLFGYKRTELIGRSVNILIPPPFAGQHDRYLKNYQVSRQQKILGTTRMLLGIGRDREIFPILLTTSVISQAGQEAFMGVIRKVDEDSRAATLYLTGAGNVISVSKAFTSLSGTPAEDIIGRHASAVFPEAGEITALIAGVVSGDAGKQTQDGSLKLVSRFGEALQVKAAAKLGGSDDQPVIALTVSAHGQETPALVMSAASGEVLHCNVALETALGAAASSLIGSNVLDLLTEPYRTFFRETALSAGAGSYHGSRRFSPSVFHGHVVQLAAKGSKGFRGQAAVHTLEQNASEGGPAARLSIVPLQGGANTELLANLELMVDGDGTVVDCETRDGPLCAPRDSFVGHAITQIVRIDGELSIHLASWQDMPQSPSFSLSPLGTPPPAHVTVTLPSGISVPACAMWRRSEGRTHIALLPFESLGVVVEVSPALTINAVLGQTSMLLGQRSDALRGKPLSDILPGMQATDISSLLAAGGKKSGGMKKKLASSLLMRNIPVASTLSTVHATVQVVSKSQNRSAWIVIDPDISCSPAPLAQPILKRPAPQLAQEGAEEKDGSPGEVAEVQKDGADMSSPVEGEMRGGDEEEQEEARDGGDSRENGDDEGDGEQSDDENGGKSKARANWAARRVEEWVTQDGVVGLNGIASEFGEPATLCAPAIKQLERALEGVEGMEGEGDTPKVPAPYKSAHYSVQASSNGADTADVPAPSAHHRESSIVPNSQAEDRATASAAPYASVAATEKQIRSSRSPLGMSPMHRQGKSSSCGVVRDTKSDEPDSEEVDQVAGEPGEEEKGDHIVWEEKGTEDAFEKLAGMSTGSGTSVGEGNNFGVVAGMDNDVDDDIVDLLGSEAAQARVKRFKRIIGLMHSPLMCRPLRILKYSLYAMVAAVLVVHCIGFGVLLTFINRHSALLNWVDLAGLSLVQVPQVVIHTRIMQASSVGIQVPGYPSFEDNRERLDREIRAFMVGHGTLYETESAFTGVWARKLEKVWLEQDIDVLLPTADDMEFGHLLAEKSNLWELGNRFVAHTLDLVQLTEQDVDAMDDLARTGAYTFIIRNGLPALLPRYRELRDVLFDKTTSNLGLVGTLSIVFLCIEAGLLLPVALYVIRTQLSGVLLLRMRQMAVLASVPRSLAAELWRRPVVLEGEDQEDDDEDVAAQASQAKEAASVKAASTKTIRALLTQKLSYDRVCVALTQLQKQRSRVRGHRALELRIMVPLVLWSIVAAVMFGVTWQLQAESAERLLPIKASHILLTLRCTSQEAALRLVLDSINLNRGSPWVCGDLLAEDKDSTPVTEDLAACDVEQESRAALQRASREMIKAAYALVYGTDDLLDLYHIPGGTIWNVPALLSVFFEEGCYYTDQSACLPKDDPSYPLLQNGFSSLLVKYSDDAEMLALDPDLTMENGNLQFIMLHGNDSMRNAQEKVHSTLTSFLGSMVLLVAIHVILLVLTIIMCIGYLLFVLRPLSQLVFVEGRMLAMLLAQLPRDLAVEEAYVTMLNEMAATDDDEETQLLEEEREADNSKEKKARQR